MAIVPAFESSNIGRSRGPGHVRISGLLLRKADAKLSPVAGLLLEIYKFLVDSLVQIRRPVPQSHGRDLRGESCSRYFGLEFRVPFGYRN